MDKWRRVFAEFIGTLILSYGVVNSKGGPYASFASLWVAMGSTGFISGGQFNPAVTIGVLLKQAYLKTLTREQLCEMLVYIGAQVIGAWVGAVISWATKGFTWTMEPHPDYTSGEAFLAELIVSSTMVMAALMVGELPETRLLQGGVVTAGLFAGCYSVGYISGSCFNPAIGFAANTTDSMDGPTARMEHMWIYIIAPSLGGVLATIIHLIYRPVLEHSLEAKGLLTNS